MQRKCYTPSSVKFDMGGEQGSFLAEFAKLNVIDKDGDVLLPGILGDMADGQVGVKVRIASWGHKWQELPVGKGEVYESDGSLFCNAKFFLDTEQGLQTYKTVKALGELCEWSFGFDIQVSEPGMVDGKNVRFLKRTRVFEVSPVLQGAGIDTHTVDIKGAKDYSTSDVGEAWSVLHPYVDGATDNSYVEDVRADPSSVIVCMDGMKFQIPYSLDAAGVVVFDEAAAMQVVETYVPVKNVSNEESGTSVAALLVDYELTRALMLGVDFT